MSHWKTAQDAHVEPLFSPIGGLDSTILRMLSNTPSSESRTVFLLLFLKSMFNARERAFSKERAALQEESNALQEESNAFRAKCTEQTKHIAVLVGLLRKLEWSHSSTSTRCEICYGIKYDNDHKPDCQLHTALEAHK